MKSENKILIIIICILLAVIGIVYQVKAPSGPSLRQEVKVLWEP